MSKKKSQDPKRLIVRGFTLYAWQIDALLHIAKREDRNASNVVRRIINEGLLCSGHSAIVERHDPDYVIQREKDMEEYPPPEQD